MQWKTEDSRAPDAVLDRAFREDRNAWTTMNKTISYTATMVKEKNRMYEEKYTPKVVKEIAAHLDENLFNLQTGQHGDFVVTKGPKFGQKQQQTVTSSATESKEASS